MPVIGTFSAVKDGYAGRIRTLMLKVQVRIIANDRKVGRRAGFSDLAGDDRDRCRLAQDQAG